MVSNFKYKFSKQLSKILNSVMKVLPTGGKSLPGYFYIRLMGVDDVRILAEDQVSKGSILITGTNGKTTTTRMIIELLSMDTFISKSFDNNTINAVTTGLLDSEGNIGVFEYGIRDIKHGQPDTVQKAINPMGVVYTTISREHTQVAGVKNPFEEYYMAKKLLSQNMDEGVIIVNADDPFTANIGLEKEKDVNVIYYGLNLNIENTIGQVANCPRCGKPLNYNEYYMNHRGDYYCSCGFKRPEPNVKINNLEVKNNDFIINIDVDIFNYIKKTQVKFNTNLKAPLLGLHNLYNTLCAITTYSTFTPKPENIIKNITEYFSNLDKKILPQGRFELIKYKNKLIGVGQGDNGDALLVNSLFMKQNIGDEKLHFIYTTPDEFEEEIFEDHLSIMKQLEPDFVSVLPGRESAKIAGYYNDQIKVIFNSEVYSIEDLNKRIEKIIEIMDNSKYTNILITGCGEEHQFWAKLIEKIKENK